MFKTYFPKKGEIRREWVLINAEGKVLGRLASQIASILRGKHKPYFTPHLDTGDFVVVINADKVRLTGRKMESKTYFSHSGYIGGVKYERALYLLRTKPEFIIQHAVKGMLPHNSLGRMQLKKLKVYRGSEHPHSAQKPRLIEVSA